MIAVVSVETLLLVVLLVLVAGLLRSNAEILRRLGPAAESDAEAADGLPAAPPAEASALAGQTEAAAISGTTPTGDAVTLALDAPRAMPTLLAFLTTGCSTCLTFWDTLGEPRLPDGIQTVIVAKGSDRERASKLRSLAPEGVPVVMSSQAWSDYAVPGAPYFVLVDGAIRGRGLATNWAALASLVGDAVEDQREIERGHGGEARARSVDETLAAAGIGPGHPSLYPGRQSGP